MIFRLPRLFARIDPRWRGFKDSRCLAEKIRNEVKSSESSRRDKSTIITERQIYSSVNVSRREYLLPPTTPNAQLTASAAHERNAWDVAMLLRPLYTTPSPPRGASANVTCSGTTPKKEDRGQIFTFDIRALRLAASERGPTVANQWRCHRRSGLEASS